MTSRDPFVDRKLTRYDFDEAYVQSCLETIAYDNQVIADREERERRWKAKQRQFAGDLGGVDAATDDDGLPHLNPVMRQWLADSERGDG